MDSDVRDGFIGPN